MEIGESTAVLVRNLGADPIPAPTARGNMLSELLPRFFLKYAHGVQEDQQDGHGDRILQQEQPTPVEAAQAAA